MSTDTKLRRQLLERLGRMNARTRRLEAEVEASDNVTRFHMERHLQSLSELLGDVNARAIAIPDEAGPPNQLERDVAVAEDELAAVEAKLVAAKAEGRGDTAATLRADLRAMAAWGSAARDELAPRPVATEQHDRKGRRATRTATLIAATYPLERDAVADFENVRASFESHDIRGRLDAAVLSRRADGKVHVVRSVEEPRHGAVPDLAARGMRHRDLKDFGQQLGRRESGLVVVVDADMVSRAEAAIARAKTIVKKQVEFDAFGPRTELESL